MNALLADVIDAHGGLTRWKRHEALSATIVTGGGFWPLKGLHQDPTPRTVRVSLHEERASVAPFGKPEWRTAFTADRVAIETVDGEVVRERLDPRAAFEGHGMNTPWDPLHRAYFSGYAMWTYLSAPFALAMPGFEAEEIAPWNEGDETWRGLRVSFPGHIASHSTQQDFYFGPDFLLRRHDYRVDVAGGFDAVQYVHDIVEVDGLKFPSRRRVYLRGPDLHPVRDLLMVSIDLSHLRLE
ncbi:hypothetical protein [Lysobacter solisilvae (ex Woo and Kim 2020)]|uniref:Uncharacterized protein n=1 Tax=Agrilutibacter terrestris TaxID=2865112 RepID=A0A7H0FXK0_9GAMM|nr:hypothetical protein [Lysobacter terrestris]QNP40766.1 hypothetical protein H8B22_00400 [Lysobacter terrestris]